jgi:hypothetical protein
MKGERLLKMFRKKKVKGHGLLKFVKNVNNNRNYVYWDRADELVERLSSLMASKQAGNSSHDH